MNRNSLTLGLALVGFVAAATPAIAQNSTGIIRGTVSSADAPAPNATVVATDVSSGFTARATAGATGNYALPGLRPGTYDISFDAAGVKTARRVTVGVGQAATLDVDVSPVSSGPDIVVTAGTLVETKTSEIGTNVTTRQIENLPQSSRNFLNFAQLAPGVRLSTNELRKTFSSGGVSEDPNGESLASPQVNVFIDGVSLKSNIQQGGLVGQDSSRGNPFPQGAVQEFRVLSSNYKAEYEDAGTSVITAVTKTGGNEFHGEVFGFYQDKNLREKDYFQKQRDEDKAKFKRKQYGVSLGGPIIQDKLNFFVAYEGNDEDRVQSVRIGGDRTPAQVAQFGEYEGTFLQPFREDLAFGKLTFQPDESSTIDLTGSYRIDKETAGFGGATSREAASLTKNVVWTTNLRWQYKRDDFLNEATVDYLSYTFEPTSLNPDLVGQDFQGVIRIGGRDTIQRVVQKGLTLRDNVTLSNVEALGGNHVIKFGGKVSFQKYEVSNQLSGNPVFSYRIDPAQGLDYSFPFEARFGQGDPNVSAKDTQIGLFVQDDWEVDSHLTFNLGLRGDWESNAKNKSFVTPADAVAGLNFLEGALTPQGSDFRAADYISSGNNRKPYTKAFQPRIGASYDLNSDQRTVLFAGWGRYFDRTLFRNAAEESLLRQYILRTFAFSRDGLPRNGQPTILWNDSYLSREGLEGLIATNAAPSGELRIIPNKLKPPRTDQFSVGIRQKFGRLQTSLSYQHIEATGQVGYFPVNRNVARNAGGFLDQINVPGFGQIVALSQDRASKYDGIFLTIDKPYTRSSPWGLNVAYTMAFSKERGYSFNFDFPDIRNQPFRPNAGNERHRVVFSGLADLPWDMQISTLMTFSSGQPFFVTDASQGFGQNVVLGNYGNAKSFRQVDVRLAKNIRFGADKEGEGGYRLQLTAEVFNLFNRANFGGYDAFIGPEGNPNFGTPNALNGPPRSFQVGARFTF